MNKFTLCKIRLLLALFSSQQAKADFLSCEDTPYKTKNGEIQRTLSMKLTKDNGVSLKLISYASYFLDSGTEFAFEDLSDICKMQITLFTEVLKTVPIEKGDVAVCRRENGEKNGENQFAVYLYNYSKGKFARLFPTGGTYRQKKTSCSLYAEEISNALLDAAGAAQK